ncbi:hypothetical protein [Candidatus Aalborgicola defluviihabitans]|uniref:hypothetical protein n=1 Tax=Candidatus Aalborgicola defluviihabitans TaxID=3386187 RepID=UPI001D78B95E|nr:hypothetical protein [Burkholderiales bacterium]
METVAELLSGRKMLPSEQDELWELDGNPAYDVAKRAMDVLMVLATAPVWLGICFWRLSRAPEFRRTGPVLPNARWAERASISALEISQHAPPSAGV